MYLVAAIFHRTIPPNRKDKRGQRRAWHMPPTCILQELGEMAKSGGAVCHVSLRDVDNQSTEAFVR
jgi:hypothetical protein